MKTDIFDRTSGVPIYRQLADYLKKQISSGIYQPGEILPSEAEIIRDLNISRTTVRLAFGLLDNSGLIRREQGRGTIVVPQVRSKLPILESISEEIIRYGRKPGSRFLSKNEEYLPSDVANILQLKTDQKAIKIVRIRTADDEPLGVVVSWLNIKMFPQLASIEGTEISIYDVFENQLGLKIQRAVENIRADLAGEFESKNLKVKSGSPILKLTRTTFINGENKNGTPIEYTEISFNGLKYSVDVELFR